MKRVALFSIVIALIVSCAAPTGAVFALNEAQMDEQPLTLTEEMEGPPKVASIEPSENTHIPVTAKMAAEEILLPEEDMSMAVALDSGQSIVISHVLTGTLAAANQELIELYNASGSDLDITGWCVLYYSSSLTEREFCFTALEEVGYRVILAANSYVILASSAFVSAHTGFTSDGTLVVNGLAETQGKVVIRSNASEQIDALGWGLLSASVEGSTVAPAPLRGEALERRLTTDGVYQDTNDNAADFIVTSPREAYQTGALQDILDHCVNV